jgi:hypothetical protein
MECLISSLATVVEEFVAQFSKPIFAIAQLPQKYYVLQKGVKVVLDTIPVELPKVCRPSIGQTMETSRAEDKLTNQLNLRQHKKLDSFPKRDNFLIL